jgi:hypothetical protein
MKRWWLLPLLALWSAAALAGCNFFAPDTSVQLLEEENRAYSTQIAEIRATATFVGDQFLATQQAAETAVRSVDLQSTRIASTLVARGTPLVDASAITPIPPTPLPIGAMLEGGSAGDNAVNPQLVTPMVTPGGSARGSIPVGPTPAFTDLPQSAPTPLPPINSSGQAASGDAGIVTDDCPVSPTSSFTAAATTIYVTAIARSLPAGSTVTSRWLFGGVEQVSYDWTPDFDIDGACIWFFITPEAVAFSPGAWSVELLLNGASVGSNTFTIAGADGM